MSSTARMRSFYFLLTLLVPLGLSVTGCEDARKQPVRRDSGSTARPGSAGGGFDWLRPRPEPEPAPPPRQSVWPPKAVWVARAAYRSPDEIIRIMDRACQAGFNTVLFQVRGEGTVYYASKIEPWAVEYGSSGPGFDPLAVACREAHRRGMALHAWVNVMPGWRGSSPPRDPRQLYNAHPDWFWYDQKGRRQPLGRFYLSVNPCLPEVRKYLVDLMREIVTKYPVDGLHLDYIRFPLDEVPKGVDYPHDKRTLWIYKRDTGKRPQDSAASWNAWRTAQVTQLVGDIRAMQKQERPDILLTAACGGDLTECRTRYFQDGAAWLRGGLVDAVFTMNYATKTSTFRSRHDAWLRATKSGMVIPGIGEYLHKSDALTIEQVKLARQWGRGLAIFSYGSLFDGSKTSRINALKALIEGR
ncbi:MAG TPA: family 10 glycosylhydrolase [Phycisphaerae bacterium]|nr:family 10 glycosylhydrolase [Phycisphaerae bacterium]